MPALIRTFLGPLRFFEYADLKPERIPPAITYAAELACERIVPLTV